MLATTRIVHDDFIRKAVAKNPRRSITEDKVPNATVNRILRNDPRQLYPAGRQYPYKHKNLIKQMFKTGDKNAQWFCDWIFFSNIIYQPRRILDMHSLCIKSFYCEIFRLDSLAICPKRAVMGYGDAPDRTFFSLIPIFWNRIRFY